MPIIKSAIKRSRQNTKHREHNQEIKKSIKVATKKFVADPKDESLLAKSYSEIDKAVKKGLINKKSAAHRKSNLSKKLEKPAKPAK